MIQSQAEADLKILKEILRFDDDAIFAIFGESGLHLLNFARQVDHRHPELSVLFKDSSDKLCQLLDLAKYAINSELSFALEAISSYANPMMAAFKNIDNPEKSQKNLRFFPESKRVELRKKKESFSISSLSFQERAVKAWSSTPNDFSSFERDAAIETSDVYKNRAERYRSIGCDELAKSIEAISGQFDISGQHYGFRKIGISQSCFILAKLHEFVLCDCEDKQSSIVINTNAESYVYVPKITPIVELDWVSEKVKKAISETERFPAAFSMPIFDHYIAITPSFGGVSRACGSKVHFEFAPKDEDIFSMSNSVVLGERDGSCYFICTWN